MLVKEYRIQFQLKEFFCLAKKQSVNHGLTTHSQMNASARQSKVFSSLSMFFFDKRTSKLLPCIFLSHYLRHNKKITTSLRPLLHYHCRSQSFDFSYIFILYIKSIFCVQCMQWYDIAPGQILQRKIRSFLLEFSFLNLNNLKYAHSRNASPKISNINELVLMFGTNKRN